MAKWSQERKRNVRVIKAANKLLRNLQTQIEDMAGEITSPAYPFIQEQIEKSKSASKTKFSYKGIKDKQRKKDILAAARQVVKLYGEKKPRKRKTTPPKKSSTQPKTVSLQPRKPTMNDTMKQAQARLDNLRANGITSSPALSLLEAKLNKLGNTIEQGFQPSNVAQKKQLTDIARAFLNTKTSSVEGYMDWKNNAMKGVMKRFNINEAQAQFIDDFVQYVKETAIESARYENLGQFIVWLGNSMNSGYTDISDEQLTAIFKYAVTRDDISSSNRKDLIRIWTYDIRHGDIPEEILENYDMEVQDIVRNVLNPARI